ncbi:EAL domain-containing protein [Thioalkalivibrio halophilus]|uniref:Response regulator receiver protein n=1 Tax=Thioalkalivibrio halophilus TaxID=252474 RepID=A0A1V2ZYD9_9GAMM|nr:EAL domain-containing protein [Thioalkalivibrio halophilus]OOC10137.1 response regulator receiver protein [Thioalkalivibrio halophilus]
MKILLVEDNPVDADLQRRALSRDGAEVEIRTAGSMAEAWAALEEARFDCVLLDLRLPDGNGMDLIPRLREGGREEAIIVMTGHGEQETVVTAFRVGADDYLPKNETYLEHLPARVRDALGRRHRRPEELETVHVLYAEHNGFDVSLTRREFARAAPHLQLEVVDSADEVLSRLEEGFDGDASYPDILLLDYRLPGMDGLELARRIRAERGLDIPVILVTGQGTEELAAQALRLGVDDYVLKSGGYLKGLPVLVDQVVARGRLRREQAALAASEHRYRQVIDSAGDIIFQTDAGGCLTFLNPAWTRMTGRSVEDALGRPLTEFVDTGDREAVAALLRGEAAAASTGEEATIGVVTRWGGLHWMELQGRSETDAEGRPAGFSGSLVDVTRRVRDQRLAAVRARVLDRLATGTRDPGFLADVIQELELLLPELSASIMLHDRETGMLECVAAPSLPGSLPWLHSPVPAGEGVGSCGTAAFRGEPVVVAEVAAHPWWDGLQAPMEAAGLQACWSFPFFDDDGHVLGTLATYLNEAREPRDEERGLIDEFTQLAGLAVQKLHAAQALDQRDRALQSSARMTLALLQAESPDRVMNSLLGRLGETLAADRAWVVVMAAEEPGRANRETHRHYWLRGDPAAPVRPPALRNLSLDSLPARWSEYLQDGEVVAGTRAEFPVEEQALLQNQGLQSLLLAPVFLEGEYRGFVGVDAVVRARNWSATDVSVARIFASSLGAALARRETVVGLRRLEAVFRSTRDGVVITDLSSRIIAVNPAFTEITGYPESEVLGQNPRILQSGYHDADFYRAMWQELERTGYWSGELWNRRRNGTVYPEWLSLSVVVDESGQPICYAGTITDMTELKRSESELNYLAEHDPLTDLPNRTRLHSLLSHAVEEARAESRGLGVLSLDLDRFKDVNDSLGHPAGDEVLVDIARRLAESVRPPDILGRLGGDEFMVVSQRAGDSGSLGEVARELLAALDTPVLLDSGRSVHLNASIGIARFPEDGDTATTLIQHADAAMFHSKENGRETWSFYEAELTRAASERLELESHLRGALSSGTGELQVHFQPQVRLSDGVPTGVECLARWETLQGESITPDRFIPVAEATGLIVPLGEQVLREACRQGVRLLREVRGDLVVAVNLSPVQLRSTRLVRRVGEILAETGFPAEQLELEVTETAIMSQGDRAVSRLKGLKSLGVRLAIDDFGTGYSSLAALQDFPLDVLKIDRSFVDQVDREGRGRWIAATIIAMARNLHLEVIAEGVETAAQAAWLNAHGCDVGQGFLYSPGLPVDRAEAWLRAPGRVAALASVRPG